MLGRVEDRGAVVAERQRGWPVGAAELALSGGAGHAVVAVVVVAGDRGELVAGQLGGLLVVDGGLTQV